MTLFDPLQVQTSLRSRSRRHRQLPLTVRLFLAALLAALVAVGASYTLRTLNL